MNRFKLFLLISLVAGSCSRRYNVTTDSMSNSFNAGQVVKLKNKPSITRGDAVFFRRDNNSLRRKETWLFRVVAFSGDTIEIKDGNLLVNNNKVELPENIRLLYSITTSRPLEVKNFRENTVSQIADNKYIAFLTKVAGNRGKYTQDRLLQEEDAATLFLSPPDQYFFL
jgi:signal peptidase I